MSKSGSSLDIDSLTIALLRASNIPARYVLGNITVADNTPSGSQSQMSRWLGAKTMLAAKTMLLYGNYRGVAYTPSGATDTTASGISFDHSWVEACVPYAHYRGSRVDDGGQRWVPMDPSFRLPQYQPGISTTSVDLDYATYLATRTNELPDERYKRLVSQSLAVKSPVQTVDAVPYEGTQIPTQWDVLPTSLPYLVNHLNSVTSDGLSEYAALPPILQYFVTINLTDSNNNPIFGPLNLFFPDIAMKRLTLDFEGGNAAAQATLSAWQQNGNGSSSMPCPLNVTPIVHLDGKSLSNGFGTVTGSVDLCTTNNILTLSTEIFNASQVVTTNQVNFTNIAAANYHALMVDGLQNNNTVISQQASNLLNVVRASTNPDQNLDAVEGGFLDIVGRKYLFHIDEAANNLGRLDDTTGILGESLGLTSTQAKIEYAFDLPFAVNRSGYLVDMPGIQDKSLDKTTGLYNLKHFKMFTHAMSAYESYIWQENARLDAVSTVRGLQYAAEKGIPILSLTNANWGSLKGQLTSNANTSDTTLNYAASDVAGLESQYFCATCLSIEMTLPRAMLRYVAGADAWKGLVFSAFTYSSNGLVNQGIMHIQGGYNGGYSLDTPISYDYSSVLDTGYSFSTPAPVPSYTNWSVPVVTPPPPIISAAVGLGTSIYSTFGGDPVNLVNGNLYHDEQDIKIKGRGGLDFVLERSYNSRDGKDGPLGFGWTHSHNQYLLFADDNPDGVTATDDTDGKVSSIIWVDATGARKSVATNATAATFTTPTGFFFTVTRQADNTILITEKSGLKYTFENKTAAVPASDAAGFSNRARLTRIEDRNGNAMVLSYVATATCNGTYVCKITDGLNRSLSFNYNTTGRLSSVADWTARQWQYGYDTLGNLTSYQNPRAAAGKQPGVSYSYYMVTDGQNLNHAMKQYTLPAGNGMNFEYYINGRVFRHYKTQHPEEVVSLSYNDFRRETIVTNELGNTSHHFFDRNGNPTQIFHEDGGIQSYTYDCRSTTDCPNPYNKLSETDPNGVTINYSYDSVGNLTKTQFPGSGAVIQHYDYSATSFGQPRRILDARGNWNMARYDTHGNVIDSILLKAGVAYGTVCSGECAIPAVASISAWTHRTYDAYGNVTQVKQMRDFTNQIGPTLDNDYNDTVNNVQGLNVVNLTRTGDKNGDGILDAPDTAHLVYDGLGRTTTGLDTHWYPVSVLTYDEVDRATVALDSVGRRIETDYDVNGNLTERRTIGGSLTDKRHFTYDNDDHQIITTDNAGSQTINEFDLAGHVIATTNPDGWRVAMQLDSMGRTTQASDAAGNVALRSYDIGGRQVSQTSALNLTVTNSYYGPAKDGRLKRMTMPALTGRSAGRAVEYDYDVAGNVIRQSAIGDDATTRDYYKFYDEQNRLVREVSPTFLSTVSGARRQACYRYSNLGQLIELWAGQTTDTTTPSCNFSDTALFKQSTWTYDDFGRKLAQTDPLSNGWSWTYDIYSNIQAAKDAKGQTTSYTWYTGGLPKTRSDQASHLTTWTYDSLFRLKTVGDANVTYTYSYDAVNRVTSVNDSRGNKTLGYQWSPGGVLNRMTDAESRITDYLYDPSGRLTGEWLPNNDYVAFEYDADGRLAQHTASTGVRTKYTWFNEGSLASINTYVKNTVFKTSVSYTLNAFGQRATIDENQTGNIVHWDLSYDNIGQLNEEYFTQTAPTAIAKTLAGGYQYDAFGNVGIVHLASGNYLAYLFDDAKQLREIDIHPTSGTAGAIALLNYDANGSLLTRQVAAGTTTYGWDELNRLKSVSIPFGTAITQSYAYDPLDRRIGKVANGVTTNYLMGTPDPTAGTYALYSSWASPDALIAQGAGTDMTLARMPLSSGTFQSTFDYHSNGQGTVTAITQENTSTTTDVTQISRTFDPWGNQTTVAGAASTVVDPNWQGRERDETGLSYFRARYYDPGYVDTKNANLPVMLGRFISRDPAGFSAGISQYAFGGNDPANMTDPTGMTAISPAAMSGFVQDLQVSTMMQQFGLGGMNSSSQNLNYSSPSFSPPANTLATVQTALAASTFVPGLGTVTGLIGATIDASQGNMAAVALDLAAAVPLVGEAGAAARTGMAVERAVVGAEQGAVRNLQQDTTYLYQKVDAEGEHLKYGITKNPETRYPQEQLAGGQLKILAQGSRQEMLSLERNLHETLPIGREEAQKFYIQKQVDKGLTPPPYSR